MTSTQIDITNGPSKFDLMIALFDMEREIRDLKFVTPEGDLYCSILGVSAEDGSGESWCLHGMCGANNYEAYFHTRTRRGWFKLK